VQQQWKGFGSYGTVGLEIVLSVLVGWFGGRWLDQRLGTAPWLMVAGIGFGIAAGYRSLWWALKRAEREDEREREKEREARKEFHERKDPPG
jgi:F0F1-type ATP synthase assembly protein I